MSQMSSSEAHHAKVSALSDGERAWLTSVVTFQSSISDLLTDTGLDGLFGRTCQVSSLVMGDETSSHSCERWGNSGIGGPTESWTLDTSEFPRAAVECLLSDILETGEVPQRYYFSLERCASLLERMKRFETIRPAFSMALKNTLRAASLAAAQTSPDHCGSTEEVAIEKMEAQLKDMPSMRTESDI